MTIETFVRKAIEGGWKGKKARFNSYEPVFRTIHWYSADGYADDCSLEEALLDPLAWAAVGKVEGWGNITKSWSKWTQSMKDMSNHDQSKRRMHRFIDNLCDGISIEDALNHATT